jgi:uncharacterized membrane protein YbhN (UPF0104 family)
LALLRRLAGSFWVRLLVSAGLLAIVATQIDFHTLGRRITGGSWGWFAAAVAVLFASFVVAALRWQLFLDAAGVRSTPGETVRAYLIGTFANNFLPSQMGGDVARVFLVGAEGTRMRAAATVVVDRATAIGCLVLTAWLAFAADPAAVPGALVAALGAATIALVLAGLVAALLVLGGTRITDRVPLRFRGSATEAGETVRACVRPPVLWRTIALGAAFQVLVVLSVWFLARAIALDLAFAVAAVTLPPVLIVAALPISIAGYGVREGSYVLLLRHVGVDATDATLLSLLAGIAFAIASLAGGVALARRRSKLPDVDRQSSATEA